MCPFKFERLHQNVCRWNNIVQYVCCYLSKCDKEQCQDCKEFASHCSREYLYRITISCCCCHKKSDKTHEQCYRKNSNSVNACSFYRFDVICCISGIVRCIDDHCGINSKERSCCCPEWHAPCSLNSREYISNL